MASIFSSLMDSIATDSFAWWFSRATLLAALACAYLALAQRARPAARHAIAVAGLCAIALLPVASAVLPTLSIPVLPPSPVAAPTPPAARTMPFAIDAAVPEPTPAPAVAPVPASMPAPARPGVAPSAPVVLARSA